MNKKIIVTCVLITLLISITGLFTCFQYKNIKNAFHDEQKENTLKEQINTKTSSFSNVNQVRKKAIAKANMYRNFTDNSIPLEAISELSTLPDSVKDFVMSILDRSNNIYLLKTDKNKAIVVYDNPENDTHGIDVAEILLENGTFKNVFNSETSDNGHDDWIFDNREEQKLPVKHIKYDNEGNLAYTEVWNYAPDAEIKYEKKDADDKPISIKKEIMDSNGDLRQEHIIYDKDGNTQMNISASYQGANIVRFTYYNANEPELGASIFSEYSSDGQKIKEAVYSSDLKLQNTYIPTLKDGERESITVLDNQNQEVNKLIAE